MNTFGNDDFGELENLLKLRAPAIFQILKTQHELELKIKQQEADFKALRLEYENLKLLADQLEHLVNIRS